MIQAVRGAIQIEINDAEQIGTGVRLLLSELTGINDIIAERIVSIQFSQTGDLTALNPATALRSEGYSDIPLFCAQEPEYDGAMPRIIRVLVTFDGVTDTRPTPVYLNGAEKLRTDLFEE